MIRACRTGFKFNPLTGGFFVAPNMADTKDTKQHELLATARKQQADDQGAESAIREDSRIDLRMVGMDQWDERLKQMRDEAGRPALTFPRMHTFVQQVANEARQRRGEIKFVASDSGDSDTPEVLEGLARHIQYNSEARVAYETAVDYSAGGGFGYYGLITDYCCDDPECDDQELKVRTFVDPFAVYGVLIPTLLGIEPDHAFVMGEPMSKDEFKSLYPDAEANDMDWGTEYGQYENWLTEDTIRTAEYWYVERETIKSKNGKRSVVKKTVKCATINGVEVLNETVWPGKRIPIFPVLGKQMIIDGKPKVFSVVRAQRDAQRLINVFKSRIAETLAIAPVSPFIGVTGQFEGHEDAWRNMNQRLTPYLEANNTDASGNPVPPPKREVAEPPIMALSAAVSAEIDDMKATSGIFDASLGAQANETSGIAIQRRQQQSDSVNMHFLDNLERSFDCSGRELACVIPVVYDAPRMVRILGADDTPKIVKINDPQHIEDGQPKHYKVGGDDAAKYDVIVTMGRSFSTKRMESFDMMSSVIQANPQVFPMIADIFFKNSDMAGADQLAERFKQIGMKQGFIQDDQQNAQIPPQLKAQMDAMSQQNEQLTAELHKALDPLEKARMDNDTKLQLARIDMEKAVAIAEVNTKAQSQLEREKWLAKFEHDLQLQAGDHADAAASRTHQAELDHIGANADAQRQMAVQAAQPEPQTGEVTQ